MLRQLWRNVNNKSLWFWGLVVVIVAIYLGHLGMYPLFNPDEGRYSEIPREMLATGNFITPHLNGVEYFEKPALQYWMTAIFMKIFGQNEFAARFFTACTALGGIFLTKYLGEKMFDRRTGILASIMVATSFLYIIIGSLNILDMAVAFFITWSMVAYYRYLQTNKAKFLYLCYAGMALGLLTKGLIGIVLVGGIVYVYLAITRQWRKMYQSISIIGIAIFLIISVPWFYLVCKENADFFHFFFIHEHFQRYLTKVHQRYEPFYFFVPCILIGIFPWTGYLLSWPKKLKAGWKAAKARSAYLYLGLWAGLIFLFFSMSDSKLVPYIVPCITPLAIILARLALRGEHLGRVVVFNLILGIIFSLALIGMAIAKHQIAELCQVGSSLIAVLLVGNISATVNWVKKKNVINVITIYCMMSLAFAFATWPVINYVADLRTGKEVAVAVQQWQEPNSEIIMYKDYVQDVPFYTNTRVKIYGYLGELEFGSKHPSGKGWFLTGHELNEEWNNNQNNIILIVPTKYWQEAKEQLHLSELNSYQDKVGKYIVVKSKTIRKANF